MSTTIIAIVIFVTLVLTGIALAMRASAKKKAASAASTQTLKENSVLKEYDQIVADRTFEEIVTSDL